MMNHFKKTKIEDANSKLQTTYNESDIHKDLSVYIDPFIEFLPHKYAKALKMADIDDLR